MHDRLTGCSSDRLTVRLTFAHNLPYVGNVLIDS